MRIGFLAAMPFFLAMAAEAQEPSKAAASPALQRLVPAMAAYTAEVLFGDVWARPGLSRRDRSLLTVTVLVATGNSGPLQSHLGIALDNGVRPAEISGLITHLAFYAGWPTAASSLDVVGRVFDERKIDTRALGAAAGPPLPLPASDAARARDVARDVAPIAPKLASLTDDAVFGDLWRRSDLSPRDRSLVTIAALVSGGDTGEQLDFHIRRGLENGLKRDEVVEAITHLAFYAGWPKAMAAIATLKKIQP